MIPNSLVKGIARIDSGGRIAIPKNMLTAMGLKEKDIVELKIVGSSKTKKITVSKR